MSTADPRKRVVVLISGRGSNMSALIAACMDPDYPARIVGVVSNRPGAKGLETASRYDIPIKVVDHKQFASRADHDGAMQAALDEFRPDIVCLAGYMRILTADFVSRYEGRLLNIHPSLLPLFPGLDTHERAIEAGMRVHGCTVHFVSEGMDEGPIIAQAAIPLEPNDTADSLGERLLRAEHRLYPHALGMVVDGSVRLESGRAVFRLPGGDEDGTGRERSPSASTILISPDRRNS